MPSNTYETYTFQPQLIFTRSLVQEYNERRVRCKTYGTTRICMCCYPSSTKEMEGFNFLYDVIKKSAKANFDYHVSFTQEELTKKEAYYNYALQDTGVSDKEGVSVFYENPSGQIFHTYSTFERGIDAFNVAYRYLDLVPKGRGEEGHAFRQYWVRRHDECGK
jgi:predicted dithiol-disulfide oxidoreductase (DUF899 family)